MSKPVPASINKRKRVKHEKWKNGERVIEALSWKCYKAARTANEAIEYARFRTKLPC